MPLIPRPSYGRNPATVATVPELEAPPIDAGEFGLEPETEFAEQGPVAELGETAPAPAPAPAPALAPAVARVSGQAPAPTPRPAVAPSPRPSAIARPTAPAQGFAASAELRQRLQRSLIAEIDQTALNSMPTAEARAFVEGAVRQLIDREVPTAKATYRDRLIEMLVDDVLGLGPREPLLRDPTISEIMVNGSKQV